MPVIGLNIDQPPGAALSKEALINAMRQVFTEVLPKYGYAVRYNQINLTEHIINTISHRGISLAESEVGTGKTLAYLLAAVLAKRGRLNDFWMRGLYPTQSYVKNTRLPIVVATSSIALQNAIAQDYIPELSKMLMAHGVISAPLSCVIRKGKEHYLCEKRLRAFYKDADEKTKEAIRPLTSPRASCDLAETDNLTAFMKRKVCISGKCDEHCSYAAGCRYVKYLKEANNPKTDFLITNHNYYLADILHRAEGKRPLLPNYQLVIIDEAHKFLTAARQMYGLSLSQAVIPQIADAIHSITEGKSTDGINVHRMAKKLENQGARLFRRLRENAPAYEDDESERSPASMDAEVVRHLRSIAGISSNLISAIGNNQVQLRHRESKARVQWELEHLKLRAETLKKHGNLICWIELGDNGDFILSAIPKDLDAKLYTDVWSKGIPIILTSGTLSAGGDFSRIKQSLGFSKMNSHLLAETSQPSPFDYKQNMLLYISEAVPFPDQQDKQYLLSVTDEIHRLIMASYGHAAVLFTSYNAMGQIFAMLKNRSLPFPMFRMGKQDTVALENFKASGNGILFASGALWEGIDIPGDALSLLIIVKLPFAVPDPVSDYEKALYGDTGAYKAQVLIPDMLVKLKQGFGRLIRIETDTGVCAILDSRARMSGAYREQVLKALPDRQVTSDIKAVRSFLKHKKKPDYFSPAE